MNLAELFPEGGRGIIGTADAKGSVNLAIFATPRIIDDHTLAWGLAEGRTCENLKQNPRASYLYLAPIRGYTGWRLTLTLKEIKEGEFLEEIRASAELTSVPSAASQIKHVAYFTVDEVRPVA
ncbi:pyridoxamine 5'-phosphate oxidase family protein [Geomesophilobacter sediminis]|uniref:Pyridoxamine 5'-phosphate oxidase family protein n=1 Tax=Geomesophilobacter sediminis TaxID=2798584 RepID=A0A8J7M290_9BACT|nr:pyridoxamine 5'-phosphate oxidase family protein [Geomesophilobacter sediminis]MBJ6726978.1 pyridoxamine 5'-phosphate oxidase family protein [Geomesophilobacter sediminis]